MAAAVSEVTVSIPTGDGLQLGGTWTAPDDPRGAVIVHGAMATPHRFYRRFAAALAERGFAVLTYDFRGVGASKSGGSLRGFEATMTDWAEKDAAAAQRWIADRAGSLPLFGVGHSFGGQIMCLLDAVRPVDAAVFMGAQSGYTGRFPLPARLRLGLVWNGLVPAALALWGYWPGWTGIGADLPHGVSLEWRRWCSDPHYYLTDHPEYAARLAAWRGPLLAMTFTDDPLVPRANAEWLLERLRGARIEHRHRTPREVGLPAVGHHGTFRENASMLWDEMDAFFTEVLAGSWRPAPNPVQLTERDVSADLAYGRS